MATAGNSALFSKRKNCLVMLAATSLVCFGCQKEGEIRRYQVARVEAAPRPVAKPTVRLLAAMVPHDKYVWFFKLRGSALVVAEFKGKFDKFVRSVQFTDH